MKRHAFDALSFLFGVFFVGLAGLAVWREEIDWNVGIWIVPAAILVLGVGLLVSSLRISATKE